MTLNQDEKDFWETLKCPFYVTEIKDGTDLLHAILYGKKTGITLPCLGEEFIKIADNVGRKKAFHNYSYFDDMKSEAVKQMMIAYPKFDETKSDKPYAYLVTVCHSAFLQVLSREKKAREVIELLKEQDDDTQGI